MMASHTGGINNTDMEEETPSHHPDSFMYAPNAPDKTSGMQELEDTVAKNQWRCSETYGQNTGTFSYSVQIRGVAMRKSHAISQQF